MAYNVFSVNLCVVFVFFCASLSQVSGQKTEDEVCECVYFYLCDHGKIIRDGSFIIGDRSSFHGRGPNCQPGFIYCCLSNTTSTGQPLDQGWTTPPSVEKESGVNSADETSTPDRAVSNPTLSGLNPAVSNPTSSGINSITSKPTSSEPNSAGPGTKGEGAAAINPQILFEDNGEPVANPVFVPKPGFCGVKRISLQQRISFTGIDDSLAQFAEFPWMLAVTTQENHAYKFQCGATLIDPQVAMTAAHCVDRFAADPTALQIRAGEWNFKSTNEPKPHQDRRVSHIELHPYYNPTDLYRHDIALVFLDSPFNITDNVDMICLPNSDALFHGSRCTVTGWGTDPSNPNGHSHNILHKVDVPVIPCTECERLLRTTILGPYFKLHVSALCAGGESGKDSCRGDGGGPLICPTRDGRWVQAGIVSWGVGCGTYVPAVYTDVSLESGWIRRGLYRFQRSLNNFRNLPYYNFRKPENAS